MTLSNTVVRVQYNGDNTTASFTVTFPFWDADDLTVILTDANGDDTTWVRGTQYTVSGGDGATGTVSVETTPTDYTPASGETLTILSALTLTQDVSLPLGGALPSADVEQRLDKNVRLIQQMDEKLDRAVLLPESSSNTDLTIPDPVADNLLRWKDDLSGLENVAASSATILSQLNDSDNDTKIDVEESADQDDIVFTVEGNEVARFVKDASNSTMKYLFIQDIAAWETANGGMTYPTDTGVNEFHFAASNGDDLNQVDVEFESLDAALRLALESPADKNLFISFEHPGQKWVLGTSANDDDLKLNTGINFGGDDVMVWNRANKHVLINPSGETGDGQFHIGAGLAGSVTAGTDGDISVIESDEARFGMSFLGDTSSRQFILFGDTASSDIGKVDYNHSNDTLTFSADTSGRMTVSGSEVAINPFGPSFGVDTDFAVNGDTDSDIFFVNAGTNNAGMRTNTPDASALLDMVSTTKGLGLPSMTTTQRDNISTPRDGLLVYNSTSNAVNGRINGSWESLDIGAMQLTRETVQASTSGTSIDFTGLPAGANRILVIFDDVSLDGTDSLLVQIGDSGGLETTGYKSNSLSITNSTPGTESSTSGFLVRLASASREAGGVLELVRITGNDWVARGNGRLDTTLAFLSGGLKSLSAELDRLSVVPTGTDNFDAGQINVFVEV